jgi:thiamine kinase
MSDQKPTPTLLQAISSVAPDRHWVTQTGGQTNHLWRDQTGLVLKQYITEPKNPLFANDPAAELACLAALAPSGLAPQSVASGTCESGAWLLYRHIPGAPWQSGTARVAKALKTLHAKEPPEGLPPALSTAEAINEKTVSILAEITSESAAKVRKLAPLATRIQAPMPAFLHGDPVPGNLIVEGDALTFIDWQCPAIGDPVHDLALFLSPAMQHVYRGAPLTADEESEFLKAYNCAETTERLRQIRPHYHWLLAAYCLWKAERGADAYAAAAHLEIARLS